MLRVWFALFFANAALAGQLTIPLSVAPAAPTGSGVSLEFEKTGPSRWQAKEPGGLIVTLESAEGGGYWASIGDLGPQLLEAGGETAVVVTRQGQPLPYVLRYRRRLNGGEDFLWLPAYRFQGAGKFGACPVEVSLHDRNTVVIAGVPAPAFGPFPLCGADWLIQTVASDSITLMPADLPPPRLGAKLSLPELPVPVQPGKLLLLDFWASWCLPCLDAFPAIERVLAANPERIQVIGINVDEEQRVPRARELTRGVSWPQVFHGLGEYEPLWRSLSKVSNSRSLELPFYAVVGTDGALLYAGDSRGMTTALRGALESMR